MRRGFAVIVLLITVASAASAGGFVFGGSSKRTTAGEATATNSVSIAAFDRHYTIGEQYAPIMPVGIPGSTMRVSIATTVAGAHLDKNGHLKENVRALFNGELYTIQKNVHGGYFIEVPCDDETLWNPEKATIMSLVDAKSGRVYTDIPVLSVVTDILDVFLPGIGNAGVKARDGNSTAAKTTYVIPVKYPEAAKYQTSECLYEWFMLMGQSAATHGVYAHETPDSVLEALDRKFGFTADTKDENKGAGNGTESKAEDSGSTAGSTPDFDENAANTGDAAEEAAPTNRFEAVPGSDTPSDSQVLAEDPDFTIAKDGTDIRVDAEQNDIRIVLVFNRNMRIAGSRPAKSFAAVLPHHRGVVFSSDNLVSLRIERWNATTKRSSKLATFTVTTSGGDLTLKKGR